MTFLARILARAISGCATATDVDDAFYLRVIRVLAHIVVAVAPRSQNGNFGHRMAPPG